MNKKGLLWKASKVPLTEHKPSSSDKMSNKFEHPAIRIARSGGKTHGAVLQETGESVDALPSMEVGADIRLSKDRKLIVPEDYANVLTSALILFNQSGSDQTN